MLLVQWVRTIIKETATEIAERFLIEMEEMGANTLHLQLLCSEHPKEAPEQIVQLSTRGGLRGRSFGRSLGSVEYCGAANIGRMRTLLRQWESGQPWLTVERYVQLQGQPREDLRQLRLY